MPRKVINNKNEISQNCLNGMQEVGLARSTDEMCESTGREGANIEADFK
jgi:hypothetical protein